MEFTRTEATNLLELFGGEDTVITVCLRDGRMCAFHTEYPEEGCVYIDGEPNPNDPVEA